jgi:hypothetical protein
MALALAWDDIPVFPVWPIANDGACACGALGCQDVGKHPIGALARRGFHDATCDLCQVVSWWDRAPVPNVGMATGIQSGLVVLDVDADKGGFASLSTLIARHGALPATWIVDTGGGGRHIYFRHPGGQVKSGVGTLGRGLDVRADGAYVITPPSMHRSGHPYRWAAAGRPDTTDLAELPHWLRTLLIDAQQKPRTRSEMTEVAGGAIGEGERNATLARIAGVMRHRGCGEEAILAALLAENARRCQPPLPDDEVARIARSIASYPASVTTSPRQPRRAQQFTPFAFRGGKAVSG